MGHPTQGAHDILTTHHSNNTYKRRACQKQQTRSPLLFPVHSFQQLIPSFLFSFKALPSLARKASPLTLHLECHVITAYWTLPECQREMLPHENLTRERKANARTRLFGGEKRDEYLTGHVIWNDMTVIANQQLAKRCSAAPQPVREDCMPDANGASLCLNSILHNIDEHLAKEILVSVDDNPCRNINFPSKIGIERS